MTLKADSGSADPFAELMADLDTPMIIVTTAAGGARAGCLVGFHAQCGIDPALYAVWLSKANHTYKIGALANVFAVHFLAKENRPLAELFGTLTGNEVDKFERCAWSPGPEGVPLLDDCSNRIVGRRDAWLDTGADHVCVMIDPIGADHADPGEWLTFAEVHELEAGHPVEDRQRPKPDE